MQEPTHILAGVLIQRSLEPVRPKPLRLALVAAAAFLSHGLLDKLANATYHPPRANFHDPVWVCFHSGVLLLTIVFLVLWWRRYWWGILFAALPDLDWIFIHGQEILHLHLPFYHQPYLHNFLGHIVNETRPFSYLRVPSHRLNPWASLWEVGLIVVLLLAIHLLNKKKSPTPQNPGRMPAG